MKSKLNILKYEQKPFCLEPAQPLTLKSVFNILFKTTKQNDATADRQPFCMNPLVNQSLFKTMKKAVDNQDLDAQSEKTVKFCSAD